ncbi:abortive infection family protein [Streptomyces sp. NPDC057794]|jgi:hypothetical protein|uniref:abortive infection family protein n=1 Tax=Streptomyces sp. NPDC057794 TaxID=3346251 RepID=UPI0036B1DADB
MELCPACDAERPAAGALIRWHRDPKVLLASEKSANAIRHAPYLLNMSSYRRDLVSRATRNEFRSLATGMTVRVVAEAWQNHNFAPVPEDELRYDDTSVRRITFETYAAAVDWSDYSQVNRALLVFEDFIRFCKQSGWEGNWLEEVTVKLERDGLLLDERGRITWNRRPVVARHLEDLTDPSGILAELERVGTTITEDPAAAIGSAKQLIEATAKTVLRERGIAVDEHAKVPALVKQAQKALHLDASSVTPGPDGTDAVKKILGGVASIAVGVAELRNRGYGTGHGQASAPSNLGVRHAHLAANAALTWCQLMLDTLADPAAPWRKQQHPTASAAAGSQ